MYNIEVMNEVWGGIKKILKLVFMLLVAIVILSFLISFNSVISFSELFDDFKMSISKMRENENIKREKLYEINTIDDMYGLWKDDSFGHKERYEALIDEDSITVYKYQNNKKYIYWIGTFDVKNLNFNSDGEQILSSKNYNQISKYISVASQANTKEFIYNNKNIRFISQFNDDQYEVTLKRYNAYNDRLRMVKYDGDRKSAWDKSTNKKIILNNWTVEYPYYFDTEEEDTFKDIPDIWVYNIDNTMIEKNLITLSPSNTKSFAELFIGEYKNANIDNINDLLKMMIEYSEQLNYTNYELITSSFDAENNLIMNICSTKYINNYTNEIKYGISFESWILKKETNEVLIIGTAYDYADTSNYDYIGDYEKVLQNITRK